MKEAAIVVFATVAFAAVAWTEGMRYPQYCPATTEIVRYYPIPEVKPIVVVQSLGWPVTERARPADPAPAAEEPDAETQPVAHAPRPHRYRHHRRRWR